MKTFPRQILALGLTLGALATATAQQPAGEVPPSRPVEDVPAGAVKTTEKAPAAATADLKPGSPPAAAQATVSTAPKDGMLRMNFRGAPLEMVLNYMSEAAGFIIVLDTEVKGKIDVWSNQPLTKDEAVDLLDSVLNKNGYTAMREGKILTIYKKDGAQKRPLPVKSGSDPKGIPKNQQMVTQIIPVRYANASQMIKDLQPLLPTEAIMTANDSGNALVITDTQINIRRMAEIVNALDTSISSVSTIHVYPLKYADAKELATAMKELYPAPQTQTNNRGGGGGGGGFPFGGGGNPFAGGNPFGGGGAGGGGNRGGGGGAAGSAVTPPGSSKVVAVADERTNSLVVSAPEEAIPSIERLIKEIDVNSNDITELRVFHLKNADPVEMTETFAQLFPDESRSSSQNQNQNQGFQFRGGPFGGFGGAGGGNRGGAATTESNRMKKKSRVMAVADQRTSSLIVSAASEMMPEIEKMVMQLDSSPAKKQKVFVYSLQNADVGQVEQALREMFERTTTSRNNNNASSALTIRSQQVQPTGVSTTIGNSGSGGQGGLGSGGTLR